MNTELMQQNQCTLNQIINSILAKKHEEQPTLALGHINRLMPIIQQSTDDGLFWVNETKNGRYCIETSQLARAVILILANCMEHVARYDPIYTFNPYINIFVKHAKNNDIIEKVQRHEALNIKNGRYKNQETYGLFVDMAERIEHFLDRLRLEMRCLGFKTVMYKAERASKKAYESLLAYIDALFRRYARLLVLRVDFSYLWDTVWMEEEWMERYAQAKQDLKRFLDNMDNNKLFEHVVGYAWKLECGPEKGWHNHLLFFLDGAKVREDKTLGMLFGEYWKNHTQNNGGYYNCNGCKSEYKFPAIGMINYHDLHLIDALKNAAQYLTKVDHIARALAPNGSHLFGHKQPPEAKRENMGRPRSFDLDRMY